VVRLFTLCYRPSGLLSEQPRPAVSSELADDEEKRRVETYHAERRSRNSGNDSWPNDYYSDHWDDDTSKSFRFLLDSITKQAGLQYPFYLPS